MYEEQGFRRKVEGSDKRRRGPEGEVRGLKAEGGE